EDGQDHEETRHARKEDQRHQRADDKVAVLQQRNRQELSESPRVEALFPEVEGDHAQEAERDQTEGPEGPAIGASLDERKHDSEYRYPEDADADEIVGKAGMRSDVRNEPQGGQHGKDADRDIDQENGLPIEPPQVGRNQQSSRDRAGNR